ncbi:unnamed protein product [Sphagnum balticum]
MGLRISTNVASLNAQRNLSTQQQRGAHALAALSSGSRIVSAADDAAGLAISEHLRGEIRGLGQASNNANNAVSLVQVGEGGLNEISNILIRLRELGVQAASDTISDKERAYIDTEGKQLIAEGDRIAKTTQFGSKKLLDGSGDQLEFQVGAFAGKDNIIKYNLKADATASTLGYDGLGFKDKGDARDALDSVDKALDKVSKLRADFGAVQSRLQSTVTNLGVQHENLSAANSRLRDADVAHETAELAQSQILQQSAVSVLSQANQSGGVVYPSTRMDTRKKYFPIDRVDPDPFTEFLNWFSHVKQYGNLDIDVMSLATADLAAKPSVRMVLFKGLRHGGFSFFTNYESQKGRELELNPQAAAAFYWPLVYRQVRIEGRVKRLSHEESEEYFHTRERGSQLAAATSHQSEKVSSFEELHRSFEATTKKYEGQPVPCPDYWGGYTLIPQRFEFWLGQDHRLHHRFNYKFESGAWKLSYLSP